MGLKDDFTAVKSFFTCTIVPSVGRLLDNEESAGKGDKYTEKEEQHYLDLIHKIVEECSSQPDEVIINLYKC